MTHPDIIEATARALEEWDLYRPLEEWDSYYYPEMAKAVLAAITPLIRADTLEQAALVAENEPSAPLKIGAPQTWMKQQIATAIRTLKEQP